MSALEALRARSERRKRRQVAEIIRQYGLDAARNFDLVAEKDLQEYELGRRELYSQLAQNAEQEHKARRQAYQQVVSQITHEAGTMSHLRSLPQETKVEAIAQIVRDHGLNVHIEPDPLCAGRLQFQHSFHDGEFDPGLAAAHALLATAARRKPISYPFSDPYAENGHTMEKRERRANKNALFEKRRRQGQIIDEQDRVSFFDTATELGMGVTENGQIAKEVKTELDFNGELGKVGFQASLDSIEIRGPGNELTRTPIVIRISGDVQDRDIRQMSSGQVDELRDLTKAAVFPMTLSLKEGVRDLGIRLPDEPELLGDGLENIDWAAEDIHI